MPNESTSPQPRSGEKGNLLQPFANKSSGTMLTALRWIVFRDIAVALICTGGLVLVTYYGGPPVFAAVLKHVTR